MVHRPALLGLAHETSGDGFTPPQGRCQTGAGMLYGEEMRDHSLCALYPYSVLTGVRDLARQTLRA